MANSEGEKAKDMFDTALQGLKPGLKVVGAVVEEVAIQAMPGVEIVTTEILQEVGEMRRRKRRK